MSIEKLDLKSPDLVNDNFEKLAQLFPNCVTESADGKAIDFDLLKQELNHAVVDGNKERYRLEWPGKRQAIVTANLPTNKTLRPIREDSVNFDSTENIYIEGDNLEVLKLLQESYLGKIKMIYIDPPYNTGNDFVYNDNFTGDKNQELFDSGQKDEYNQRLVANPETAGRYHSDWLSMMYPRLKLARNLLKEDGVIFISIDDNEVHNLRKVCDDIFGETQFVGTFTWRSRTAKADVPFGVSVDVEWIVSYAKKDFIAGREGERKYFTSDDVDDRWRLSDLTTNKSKEERPNSFFTMINPRNGESFEASELRTWAVTIDTFNDYYKRKKIVFPNDYNFLSIKRPAYRVFESEDKQKAISKYGSDEIRMSISTYLSEKEVGRTEHGSKEIRELFNSPVFSYPKPTSLLTFFIKNISDNDAIILDFFSGSSSTADAVIQLNEKDGGSRKFIMVQLPEQLNTTKNEQRAAAEFCKQNNLPLYLNEVAKERIRRASRSILEGIKNDILTLESQLKFKNESLVKENALMVKTPERIDKLTEEIETIETNIAEKQKILANLDTGFRVYRLDSSNMQDVYYKPQEIQQITIEQFAENIKPDRSADDLLAQVLLDWGLPLSIHIEKAIIEGKEVFKVGGNSLYACFDSGIDEVFAKAIALEAPMRIVFRDNGFKDDTAKVNVQQLLKQLSAETEVKVI